MERRPNSVLGLTVHYVKTKWASMGRASKVALVAALVVFGMWGFTLGRCMLGSGGCPASGGCPYSADAPPCGG
jgi:hypothetical protein